MRSIKSVKVHIKPGVIRSVHLASNGVARWVVSYKGNMYNLPGIIENGNFVPSTYSGEIIVESYVPKRVNRKQNNVEIRVTTPPTGTVNIKDQIRRIRYTNYSCTRGWISFGGKRMVGTVKDGNFVPIVDKTDG